MMNKKMVTLILSIIAFCTLTIAGSGDYYVEKYYVGIYDSPTQNYYFIVWCKDQQYPFYFPLSEKTKEKAQVAAVMAAASSGDKLHVDYDTGKTKIGWVPDCQLLWYVGVQK